MIDFPALNKVLEGTHPTLTQVPPTVPRSIIATFAFKVTASMADEKAAPPEPMMM